MTHNATRKEHSFSGASPFDVEDLVVDLIYWFHKITKCKKEPNEFCIFGDTTLKQVLNIVSTH
jgi:hypothetical protein